MSNCGAMFLYVRLRPQALTWANRNDAARLEIAFTESVRNVARQT